MPEPWRSVALPHLGGLDAIGLDPEGDHLLVLSSSGRGVLHCRDGRKVARDEDVDESTWLDRPCLLANGIGPLEGRRIRVAGSFIGGGLATTTHDGWRLLAAAPRWPRVVVWCEMPGTAGFFGGGEFHKLWDWDEPFAYGFSESGRTAVIACSNEVVMWVR
jgi:hypothetical protein